MQSIPRPSGRSYYSILAKILRVKARRYLFALRDKFHVLFHHGLLSREAAHFHGFLRDVEYYLFYDFARLFQRLFGYSFDSVLLGNPFDGKKRQHDSIYEIYFKKAPSISFA